MLMHRRYKGSIDRNTTNMELSEFLDEDGKRILEHEVFDEGLWDTLFDISIKHNTAFYRLIERLEQDLSLGKKLDMDDLIFDVDMENVVTDKANLSATSTTWDKKKDKLCLESTHQISALTICRSDTICHQVRITDGLKNLSPCPQKAMKI